MIAKAWGEEQVDSDSNGHGTPSGVVNVSEERCWPMAVKLCAYTENYQMVLWKREFCGMGIIAIKLPLKSV